MTVKKSNWWLTETCDRCPTARPKVVFILASGNMLMLCGHCRTKYGEAIEQYLGDEPNTIHAPVDDGAKMDASP